MRVSESQGQQVFLRNLQRVRSELHSTLEKMATGKRVRFASDDPHASAELMRLYESSQRIDARQRSISQSRAWMELTEKAVSEVGNILATSQQLAVQASSETLGQSQLDAIAEQVNGLRQQLLGIANYSVSGSFIFSGTLTNTEPYDDTGAYQGNDQHIDIPIDQGTLQLNLTGREVFGEIGGGGAMDLLDEFETVLRAGDTDTIQTFTGQFRDAVSTNSSRITKIGTLRSRLEQADVRLDERKLEYQERIADLGAVDMAKAISDAQRLETGYQSTLNAGARLFGPTFFDYLG
jgi:flagellar hook-associated protein 3 FlgL